MAAMSGAAGAGLGSSRDALMRIVSSLASRESDGIMAMIVSSWDLKASSLSCSSVGMTDILAIYSYA